MTNFEFISVMETLSQEIYPFNFLDSELAKKPKSFKWLFLADERDFRSILEALEMGHRAVGLEWTAPSKV